MQAAICTRNGAIVRINRAVDVDNGVACQEHCGASLPSNGLFTRRAIGGQRQSQPTMAWSPPVTACPAGLSSTPDHSDAPAAKTIRLTSSFRTTASASLL